VRARDFADGVLHQMHVVAVSATATCKRYCDGPETAALQHLAQMLLAIHDRQWDTAAARLDKIREALS
jgi:hypothetical protein